MKLILSLLTSFSFSACSVHFDALPEMENEYNLTTEVALKIPEKISFITKFYNQGEEGLFYGKEGVPIYYKVFQQEVENSPAILISAGRTEAALKYQEVIYDLYQNGFSIYIHDHRGQGESGRMTKDPEMGYIDSFQYYVDDMKYFYDSIYNQTKHSKKLLLAHSMGGAIGMTYLEQFPTDFHLAAFTSPMLGLPFPTCLYTSIMINDTITYARGENGYWEEKDQFEENEITNSTIRYQRINTLYDKTPSIQLGGVTYHWVNRSCQQFHYIFNHIDQIATPFILFSAENETIVSALAHQRFIDKAIKQEKECKAYSIGNAKHELLFEQDNARLKTINTIIDFFRRE